MSYKQLTFIKRCRILALWEAGQRKGTREGCALELFFGSLASYRPMVFVTKASCFR